MFLLRDFVMITEQQFNLRFLVRLEKCPLEALYALTSLQRVNFV